MLFFLCPRYKVQSLCQCAGEPCVVVGTPTRIRSVTKRGRSVLRIWKKEKGTYLEERVGWKELLFQRKGGRRRRARIDFPFISGKGEIKRGKTWTNVTFPPFFFFSRGKLRKALCVCANAANLFGEVSIPTNEKRNTEREDRPSSSWHLRCPNEPLLLLFLFLLLLVLLTTKEAITQSGGRGGGGMPLFVLLLLLISRTLREKEHKLEAPPPPPPLSSLLRKERRGEANLFFLRWPLHNLQRITTTVFPPKKKSFALLGLLARA